MNMNIVTHTAHQIQHDVLAAQSLVDGIEVIDLLHVTSDENSPLQLLFDRAGDHEQDIPESPLAVDRGFLFLEDGYQGRANYYGLFRIAAKWWLMDLVSEGIMIRMADDFDDADAVHVTTMIRASKPDARCA